MGSPVYAGFNEALSSIVFEDNASLTYSKIDPAHYAAQNGPLPTLKAVNDPKKGTMDRLTARLTMEGPPYGSHNMTNTLESRS